MTLQGREIPGTRRLVPDADDQRIQHVGGTDIRIELVRLGREHLLEERIHRRARAGHREELDRSIGAVEVVDADVRILQVFLDLGH